MYLHLTLITYCNNPLARLLCLPRAHRSPLLQGRLALLICAFLCASLQISFSVYLTRMTGIFSEALTQKEEWKERSPQKTGWVPPFASGIYLSNVFSTYCLCFSMKIQLSCQTCITNDTVCLYKKSGILCNGTVYSSQIYARFQGYFFNYNLFQWKQKT